MDESGESTHATGDLFFQHCCQGFEYAEDVLRQFVKKAIEKMHKDLKVSFKQILRCIYDTDTDMICMKGWKDTLLEHQCKTTPTCNKLVRELVSKLPFAFLVNRAKLVRMMFQNDSWEFTKLFLEPWMWSLPDLEKLDMFCLLVFIDNTSEFNHESLPKISSHLHTGRGLYQQRARKMRDLAEACFRTEDERLSKEERDACLQATIDMLAFVSNDYAADVAIGKIQNIKDRDTIYVEGHVQRKRFKLKKRMKIFERKMREFASKIPHEEQTTGARVKTRQNGNIQNITDAHAYYKDVKLIRMVLETENLSIQNLFRAKNKKPVPANQQGHKKTSKDEYKKIQGLLYYLQKNGGTSDMLRSLLELMDGSYSEMTSAHYNALQNVLKRQFQAKALKEIVSKEAECSNFKLCYQAMLTFEKGLRRRCKEKIESIHRDVVKQFQRNLLCQGADQNDICERELRFKHTCLADPECNTILELIWSKISAKCNLTQRTMFKGVNPQDCIDNCWEFTKVFLDPSMRTFNGFEDLDTFCLLTLLTNVTFDTKSLKSDELLRTMGKVRDSAFNLLRSPTKEQTKASMDSLFDDIIYILSNDMFPCAERVKQQMEGLSGVAMTTLFDIRLAIESKRQRRIEEFYEKSFIRDKNISNWCRCACAFKYVQRALLPIVEKKLSRLRTDAEKQLNRKLCAEANSDDIKRDRQLGAEFKHDCTQLVPCKTLLYTIKKNTTDSVDMFTMVKGSDPQTWLDSPFSFTRVFLNDWRRRAILQFEDCDVSALCYIILRCKPLQIVCHKAKVGDVKSVRNRIMHSATMIIGQQEMDEYTDVILQLLRQIEQHQVGREVTEAIEHISKLTHNDEGILRDEGEKLFQMNIKLELTHKEASIENLHTIIAALENLECKVDRYGTQEKNDTPSGKIYFWCICAVSLKYLQNAWMRLIKRYMKMLYSDTVNNVRGQCCSMASSTDIIRITQLTGKQQNKVKFKHMCSDPTYKCSDMLISIQNNIPESVDVFKMLRDTDPQTWLSSFEDFIRIFMKGWRRHEMTKIEDCDITALCHIVKTCQPLLSEMDGILVTKVNSVRNKLVHCASLNISHKEMEEDIDVILEFVQHLKTLDVSPEIEDAEKNIEQLRSSRITDLREQDIQLLHEMVSDMKLELKHKEEEAENLRKKRNALETLSSDGGPPDPPSGGQPEYITPEFSIQVDSASDQDIETPLGDSSSENDLATDSDKASGDGDGQEHTKRQRMHEEQFYQQLRQLKEELIQLKRQLEEERQMQRERELQRQQEERQMQRERELQRQQEEEHLMQREKEPFGRRIFGAILGGMLGAIADPAGVAVDAAVVLAFLNLIDDWI